jgi:predicted porin
MAWVGVAGKFGELRFGRDNTPLFNDLGSLDTFAGATFASFQNNVTGYTPRFDNTITYRTPIYKGVRVQLGVAPGGIDSAYGSRDALNVYIAAAEYNSKSNKVYLASNFQSQVAADHSFSQRAGFTGGSYDYGRGKIYAVYFHGNSPDSNVGSFVSNKPTGVVHGTYYDDYAFSANYRMTDKWRVGGGWGWGVQESKAKNNTHEPSVISCYDFSKWGMLYATGGYLVNENGAAFGLSAAGPITKNIPAAGHNVGGVQVGLRVNFSGQIIRPE